jgi:acyl-CoA reductase-like NAD-dependent aldehyde dehydrogenase
MKITSTNPSRNYEVIGEVEISTEQDIEQAVERTREAGKAWANLTVEERCKALASFVEISKKRYEEIARLIATETGKPITQARANVDEGIHYFEAFFDMAKASLAPKIVFQNDTEAHYLVKEPRGVFAVITPWNFPFLNIPFQCGQALIAGNTVVYKTSEENLLFAKLAAELVKASDIPPGVFEVIYGDGKVGELLARQKVDAISFTGSTKTGQTLARIAAETMTPLLTEMGGSAPAIIFEDCDIENIIGTLYEGRFSGSGQDCCGIKRLIVHESKVQETLEILKSVVESKKVGDALDEDTDIGPLVARRQLEILESQVADALEKGAKIITGGKRPENLDGAYYLPTILTEEVFGPVLPVVTFKTEEEAVRLANDTIYGLGAYVFTNSPERYARVAKQIQTGEISQNNTTFFSPSSPFGGQKQSGNSHSGGQAGFDEVTKIKLISQEKPANKTSLF